MGRKEELTEQLTAALKAANEIATAADDAGRDFTADERSAVSAKMAEAKELKGKLVQLNADSDMRKAVAELGEGIELSGKGDRRTPAGLVVPDGRKSLGQHVIESVEYKELLDSAAGGVFTKQHRVQSRPVGFKALVTGADSNSAGVFVNADEKGVLQGPELLQRPLTIRDLVTGGSTTSDTIRYVKIESFTNAATPVAESTSTAAPGGGPSNQNAANGYKPQSGFTTNEDTATVKTIAHWIPVTKQALSDAAQIRTLIDGFLTYGLEEELEDQMVAGDGDGENFEGLLEVTGVQELGLVGPSELDLLRTLRKAKTLVRLARANASAYVMNPADLERVDLVADGENRFYFGGPAQAGGTPPLWGLPVVESEAVPAGTALVGDWSKAILWDREQASITVSDSHADFFVRNMVAILAEMRAAFGVIQPNAFVKVDLEAAAS